MEPFEQIPEVNVSLNVCLTQEDGDPVFAIQRRTNHSGVLNAIYVSKYKYSYKSNPIIKHTSYTQQMTYILPGIF